MTEWRRVGDTNVEVSNDGRVRRDGVEFVPCVACGGYRVLRMNGKLMLLHRLIANAFIPNPKAKKCVDHVNGDKLNNCVENLRWATDAENSRNCKPRIRVSELPRGIYEKGKRFQARIKHDSKWYNLGTYDTPEEASEIYEVTAEELFGEFYRKPE